jgi:hypothetical protein
MRLANSDGLHRGEWYEADSFLQAACLRQFAAKRLLLVPPSLGTSFLLSERRGSDAMPRTGSAPAAGDAAPVNKNNHGKRLL